MAFGCDRDKPVASGQVRQRAAQFRPRRMIVRISGTSNSFAWWPSEE
jgi:hypothetical protein